jgi:hypothetical protein
MHLRGLEEGAILLIRVISMGRFGEQLGHTVPILTCLAMLMAKPSVPQVKAETWYFSFLQYFRVSLSPRIFSYTMEVTLGIQGIEVEVYIIVLGIRL